MSEPIISAPWIEGARRYHRLPARSPEQIDAAYYEALTSPAGQIVMDDLYLLICASRLPSERELGQHDLWVYILRRMAEHEGRGRGSEHEPEI